MSFAFEQLSVSQLRLGYLSREFTPVDVLTYYRQCCENLNPYLGAYVRFFWDTAFEQARWIESQINQGETIGRLAGIPIAIKDNIQYKDHRYSCSSRILDSDGEGGTLSAYHSTVVEKLLREGAVIIGSTNMDEFAMGSSTETSSFSPCCNPWGQSFVPGGSSGGSAVAVSAGLCSVALGSDTGGSIRQPASFCGVTGYKPAYGQVSRYGLVAFGSSLDQIGPLARCVEDVRLVMEVIEGRDDKDSTSLQCDWQVGEENDSIDSLKLSFLKDDSFESLEDSVKSVFVNSYDVLSEVCSTEYLNFPELRYSVPVYYILATAEASSNLARYDGVRYGHRDKGEGGLLEMYLKTRSRGFGSEVKRRILLGAYVLSAGYYDAYYKKAQKVRELIVQGYRNVFEKGSVDAIVLPTSPTPAFAIGEKLNDPLSMYLADIFTIAPSLAGLPAISLPCGFVDGLPLGIQIVAPPTPQGVSNLFKISRYYQNRTSWHLQSPSLDFMEDQE